MGLTAPGRISKFAPDTSAVLEEPLGAIAQLGERYNGIVEVTGSIPVGSTNLEKSWVI